jgi:saccharopine dehydrogenase-like NADP-dependent oxidoreductase
LYGYALHVEVTGKKNGQPVTYVLTHTHPPSDGSIPDWAGLRAYTRCVGIPLAIGAQLIAAGKTNAVGAVPPELGFDPATVFEMLEARQIVVHERTASSTES